MDANTHEYNQQETFALIRVYLRLKCIFYLDFFCENQCHLRMMCFHAAMHVPWRNKKRYVQYI